MIKSLVWIGYKRTSASSVEIIARQACVFFIDENANSFATFKVTIMGESAGASCIGIHLQRNVIAGLARAAVCLFFRV